MLVRRVWNNNKYGNFSYLVGCPRKKVALVVDPYTPELCVAAANQSGWKISAILNTHEHFDHTYGNTDLAEQTGARLLVSRTLADRIDGADEVVEVERPVVIGDGVLQILHTPGHTMGHICVLVTGVQPALIAGDTLFNAGVGNCRNGGDVDALFETIARLARELPGDCLIYPGHDYAMKNLAFALHVDPDNAEARRMLSTYENTSDRLESLRPWQMRSGAILSSDVLIQVMASTKPRQLSGSSACGARVTSGDGLASAHTRILREWGGSTMSYRKCALAMAVVTAAAVSYGCGSRQQSNQSSSSASSIQRGEYLVRIGACNDCHTPGYLLSEGQTPVDDWLVGDTLGWRGPWGTTYPRNLRLRFQDFRNKEEWIGYARAIRPLPPMAWFNLAAMSDEDLGAVYDFVRYLGPKGSAIPANVSASEVPNGPVVQFPM